jgi:hypothetical protein
MTDRQINHRVAEACGWTQIRDSGIWHNFEPWGYPPEKPGQGGNAYNFLPKYCSDLNAMHEAEEFLYGNLWIQYVNELADEGSLFGIRATARQRAEAFLRTLGLWEEVQK